MIRKGVIRRIGPHKDKVGLFSERGGDDEILAIIIVIIDGIEIIRVGLGCRFRGDPKSIISGRGICRG